LGNVQEMTEYLLQYITLNVRKFNKHT